MSKIKMAAAVCYVCGKEFSKDSNCNRHIKDVHKIGPKGEPIPETPPLQYLCATCGRKFSQKSTLRRHIDTLHESPRKPAEIELKCDECDFRTAYRSNLKRHWAKIHQGRKPAKKGGFQCSLCSAKYQALKNLKYHERKKHKLGVVTKTKRKCPLCKFVSLEKSKQDIFNHFRVDHNVSLNWQTYNFNSLTEFEFWKKNIEQANCSYYSKKFEVKQQVLYVCHRSGNYVTKGANIRRLKSIGSCKINGYCPSVMRVNVGNDGSGIKVQFLPVHVGHESDPKYVRPSCGGLGGGRKYRRAIRDSERTKQSSSENKNILENAVIVAVINENIAVANEVVVDESVVPELCCETAVDDMAANPHSYNEDLDTMLYLEKVKLFQEFRDFEGFLQKNVTSIAQINHVRREMNKIVSDINASNSTMTME